MANDATYFANPKNICKVNCIHSILEWLNTFIMHAIKKLATSEPTDCQIDSHPQDSLKTN